MGMFWQYFSFEPKRWLALFDGTIPSVKKRFVSAAWEPTDENLPDPEQNPSGFLDYVWRHAPRDIVEVAEHLARHGPSYRGLSAEQSRMLDSMISGFFGAAGLESTLSFTREHRMGLSDRAMTELLSRAEPARVGGFLGLGGQVSVGQPVLLAPWLATGRRIGLRQAPNPEDRYFVFDEREVNEARQEGAQLLAVDRPWRTPEFESSVRAELLPALERATSQGRYLAGRFT